MELFTKDNSEMACKKVRASFNTQMAKNMKGTSRKVNTTASVPKLIKITNNNQEIGSMEYMLAKPPQI